MPKLTAKADTFRDWEALIGACNLNAETLPGVETLRTELETLLVQARDLKIHQEGLEGDRVATTQQLEKAIDDGEEVVRKIRAFAVVKYGSANMQLKKFGVAVRKGKGSRKAKKPTPAPQQETLKGGEDEKPVAG
jgi:hypothetical protein